MNQDQVYKGRCLCGAVKYHAAGDPQQTAHCHCVNCRRSIGAAFATGVSFPIEAVTWTQEEPSSYQSSEQFARLFCSRCGSSIAQHNQRTDTIWLLIGTLDHPEYVAPDLHMFTRDQIPWIELDDDLPRHHAFPPPRKGQRKGESARPEID